MANFDANVMNVQQRLGRRSTEKKT